LRTPFWKNLTRMALMPLAAVSLIGTGCQQKAGTEPETQVTVETTAPTPGGGEAAGQTAAAGTIEFLTSPDAALTQASNGNKLVMVDVYTDWCTWCHKLDEEVYAKPAVASALQKDFVSLKVNPEKADKDFVDKYGVEGFPTILFLNGKGKEVHRIVGYVPEADFLKELETAKQKAASA